MPTPLATDASTYLRDVYGVALPKRPVALVQFLANQSSVPASDRKKVELIAIAVALVILHGEDKAFLKALTDTRAVKRKVDISRLVVETLYADAQPSTTRTRTLSAWSVAVRYLVGNAVHPTTIPDLALSKG